MIRWADILDAEFAQTWPAQVVHHTLQRHRFTAAFPAYETDGEKVEDEPGVMNEIPEAPKEGRVSRLRVLLDELTHTTRRNGYTA